MKLSSGQVNGFLRNPGECRVVLLFGDDAGMIRDRAETLVRAVAGSLDDPFLVTELAREEISRLPDEAAGLSLMGSRRIIRVRDATDAAAGPVQLLLKGPAPALVVLEAPAIAARSKLRTLLEAAPDGAAIGCYPEEGRALQDTIRETLRAAGVGIDPDALAWLAEHLGADRASTRGEVEKLALFVGPGGRVTLDDAMACVGDLAGLSLDDALFAATTGDITTTDRALETAMAEGAAPVQVVRAALAHLQRLHRARLAMDEQKLSAADAAKTLRPPVFWQKVGPFTRSLSLWPAPSLLAGMAALAEAERGCKRTGWPDQTLCRSAILTLARRAALSRDRATRNRGSA
ncbi:MAG TPA: DNA polymerase III subunit delta [Rhodopila sp.]|nr:DNA polymerase III subunit delta [Rhodopila sp.]